MILVLGATGRVGGAASAALARDQIQHRVLVRNANKLTSGAEAHIEVVEGDLQNTTDVQQALSGITGALLVMGNHSDQPGIEREFARLAADAGVEHVVKISSMEAAPEATAAFPKNHYDTEQHIRSLGLDWTFLRPNFFMQNMLMYAGAIANASLFALPLGESRTAMVDTRDVGEAAAVALTDSEHRNKTYALTGPDLITFDEAASIMTEVLGKPVRYVQQTPQEFRDVLSQFVKDTWQLDGVCELFQEIAGGSLDEKSNEVQQLLGREPISLSRFVADHAAAFGP